MRSFALHLANCAGGWALGAVLEPFGDPRERRDVDLRRPRPGEDGGDIEVSDREPVAEQTGGAAERAVEHPERLSQALLRVVRCRSIPISLRKDSTVEECRQQRPLDLGHAPKTPLPSPRLVLGA